MMQSKHLLKSLVCTALFCAAAVSGAGQEKEATQSSSSVEVKAISSSDTAQFEVAPGIQLPANGIVWILDMAESKPDLVRIYHNNASPNRHRGANFARTQFLLKQVLTFELPDAAAKLRVSNRTPIIFVRKSAVEEELQSAANGKSVQAHHVLLRMRIADDRRVLCYASYGQIAGKPTRHEDEVEVLTEEVAAGQWLKITPKQPLPDGEYAVAHMPDDKALIETFAYDFGIGAPARQPANK
jgi:hypothetical protein